MKLAALFILAAALPGAVEASPASYLGFEPKEFAVAADRAVVRELERHASSRQVSVAGIVRIEAPPARILRQLQIDRGLARNSEDQPGGRFSHPARLRDVADFRLPDSDIAVLADCKIARCKFKMGARGFQEYGKIDWSGARAGDQARATARRLMVDYVNGYRTDGAQSLVTYRDKKQPTSLSSGLRRLLEGSPYFKGQLAPQLDRQLVSFPGDPAPGAKGSIHWSLDDYGYRPVTDIVHAVTYHSPEPVSGEPTALVTQKHIFTSHYFEARVEFFALFRDESRLGSPSTYLAYLDRSRFDDDLGSLKRLLLVREALADVRDRLMSLRARIEG
jgi:hypothetical protein